MLKLHKRHVYCIAALKKCTLYVISVDVIISRGIQRCGAIDRPYIPLRILSAIINVALSQFRFLGYTEGVSVGFMTRLNEGERKGKEGRLRRAGDEHWRNKNCVWEDEPQRSACRRSLDEKSPSLSFVFLILHSFCSRLLASRQRQTLPKERWWRRRLKDRLKQW